MTEERQENPAPAPDSPLLEPKDSGLADFVVPAAVGVGGIALLLYSSKRGSEKKKSKKRSKPAPKPDSDQVTFSDDYTNYEIGSEWVEMVLEPYLAEQAEEHYLAVADSANEAAMADTRAIVMRAFTRTHRVKKPSGEVLISELPSDQTKVREFLKFIEAEIISFQRTY